MDVSVSLKNGLSKAKIFERFKERANKYHKIKGLSQKYYVQKKSTNNFCGVFISGSIESHEAYGSQNWQIASEMPINFLSALQEEFVDFAYPKEGNHRS